MQGAGRGGGLSSCLHPCGSQHHSGTPNTLEMQQVLYRRSVNRSLRSVSVTCTKSEQIHMLTLNRLVRLQEGVFSISAAPIFSFYGFLN